MSDEKKVVSKKSSKSKSKISSKEKSKSRSSTLKSKKLEKKLLVVFDIDETMIQFIGPYDFAKFEETQDNFDSDTYQIIQDRSGKKSCILFRPYLKEVIELIKRDPFFVPAIWTYSEREYAFFIAKVICEKFGLPFEYDAENPEGYNSEKNFFFLIYGNEDVLDEDYPKDLHQIYDANPQFNVFNTFLVDDRYGNMSHSKNNENGLFIQGFAPFGAFKQRESLDESRLSDNTFKELIDVLKAIKKDINSCTKEEYLESLADPNEAVFSEKRIKRMKLEKYYKTFATKFQKRIFLGEKPFDSGKFIYIKNYDDIAGKNHGGKATITNKRTARKTRKTTKTVS
jgi:hypothetical protein